MKLDTLHARSLRRCSTPGCSRIPEPKDDLCMVCQLGLYVPTVDLTKESERLAVTAAARNAVEVGSGPAPAPDRPPDVVRPWQVRVGREGALTGRVPVVAGRLMQAWAPRVANGLGDF